MAQIFPKGANWFVRWTMIGVAGAGLLVGAVSSGVYWSPVITMEGIARQQPIPFSHVRHVQGNGIDCRYCHTTVETTPFAGIPPTETCMTCHSQIFNDQDILAPARESWSTGKPMEWSRIYDLPDFVYFNHSIHVAKGVGCSTCHGRVDEMALTYKAKSLRMSWCLACHRHPEKFVRPLSEVFNMEWEPSSHQREEGLQLVEDHNIEVGQLINCSICHR